MSSSCASRRSSASSVAKKASGAGRASSTSTLKSVRAFPSSDRYDQDDVGEEDHDAEGEDDQADEGDVKEAHGHQADGGQEGEVRLRKEKCACHEEEGRWHFRAEGPVASVGDHLRWEEDARTEVTKKIWVYIKKNKLNDDRTIKPDSTLKAVFPVASIDMLKMAGYVSKHLS